MRSRISRLMVSAGMLAAATMLAGAASGGPSMLGSRFANVPSARNPARVPGDITVKPTVKYAKASYATGGVALRNRSTGVINISGVTGPVQAAWLYFTYLYGDTAPPKSLNIKLSRLFPAPASTAVLKAVLYATSADPCWGSNGGALYRASVPVGLAVASGSYQVFLPSAVVGLNTGEDPWDLNVVTPLDEGASLVVIGTGTSRVDLFDKGMAGIEASGSFSYTLGLSSPVSAANVLFDSIGADGQIGGGRSVGLAADTTFINGVQIAGTGSPDDPDSDWNGNAGFPLPQLWDDIGHDITDAAPGGTTALRVTISPDADCIITVANVVAH